MIQRVYIGFDARESAAAVVAVRSLHRYSPDAHATLLRADRLRDGGLLRRLQDRRRGETWDLASNAACSTDFAISRFLVPHLAHEGTALFVDSDVVFLADVAELFALADPRFAVQVVKHPPLTAAGVKMDGQTQAAYPRKNWSSVVLWNCEHPANRRLALQDVNERPGRDLHAFYWLADDEIGELPAAWNWLVNVTPRPDSPKLAHFTQGGPFTPGWDVGSQPFDELWLEASRE